MKLFLKDVNLLLFIVRHIPGNVVHTVRRMILFKENINFVCIKKVLKQFPVVQWCYWYRA